MEKRYYVYGHYIEGTLFYIGSNCGTNKGHNPNRAWDISNRNRDYADYVGERLNEVEVEILEWLPVGVTSGECQSKEIKWIHHFHDLGLAHCSNQDHRGRNNSMYGKGDRQLGSKNPMYGMTPSNARPCILYNESVELGRFSSLTEAKVYLENEIGGKLGDGIKSLLKGWVPSTRSQLYGYSAIYKDEYKKEEQPP